MLLVVPLYCLVAAILVVVVSMRAEAFERKCERPNRPGVIGIDSARPRMPNVHKHA